MRVKHRFDQSTIYQDFTLVDGEPFLRDRVVIQWNQIAQKDHDSPMLKLACQTSFRNPSATFSIPYGHIERPLDGQEVPSQEWTEITEHAPSRETSQPPTNCRIVDLSQLFDRDVFATESDPKSGAFDPDGRSFPESIIKSAHPAACSG